MFIIYVVVVQLWMDECMYSIISHSRSLARSHSRRWCSCSSFLHMASFVAQADRGNGTIKRDKIDYNFMLMLCIYFSSRSNWCCGRNSGRVFTCCWLCCLHNILFTNFKTENLEYFTLVPVLCVHSTLYSHHRIHALLQTYKKFVELHFRMAARSERAFTPTVNLLHPFRFRVGVCAKVRGVFSAIFFHSVFFMKGR